MRIVLFCSDRFFFFSFWSKKCPLKAWLNELGVEKPELFSPTIESGLDNWLRQINVLSDYYMEQAIQSVYSRKKMCEWGVPKTTASSFTCNRGRSDTNEVNQNHFNRTTHRDPKHPKSSEEGHANKELCWRFGAEFQAADMGPNFLCLPLRNLEWLLVYFWGKKKK